MRRLIKSSAAVIALCALFGTESANANLIGLDFGSSFMKATLVKPGKKFEIVENTASGRKTASMVTLGKENRLYGADSLLESGKYPQSTFADFWRIFGNKFDSDALAKFKVDRMVTNDFVADERGLISWKVQRAAYGEQEAQDEILYAEEVVAMMLQYYRMLAEKLAGERVDEAVITIPSWFTYE